MSTEAEVVVEGIMGVTSVSQDWKTQRDTYRHLSALLAAMPKTSKHHGSRLSPREQRLPSLRC